MASDGDELDWENLKAMQRVINKMHGQPTYKPPKSTARIVGEAIYCILLVIHVTIAFVNFAAVSIRQALQFYFSMDMPAITPDDVLFYAHTAVCAFGLILLRKYIVTE